MKKGTKKADENRKQYNSLTAQEQKIYDSVMESFPMTSHDSAYNAAIQGGVSFQFVMK